jgi:hypothetical protein
MGGPFQFHFHRETEGQDTEGTNVGGAIQIRDDRRALLGHRETDRLTVTDYRVTVTHRERKKERKRKKSSTKRKSSTRQQSKASKARRAGWAWQGRAGNRRKALCQQRQRPRPRQGNLVQSVGCRGHRGSSSSRGHAS